MEVKQYKEKFSQEIHNVSCKSYTMMNFHGCMIFEKMLLENLHDS